MCLELAAPMGPTAIAAFSSERLCSTAENKITNFIPKISQQCSVSLPHLPLDECERQSHFCKIQERDWEHNGKASSPVPLRVCYATLFSPSRHSGARSPPPTYGLIYK